MPKKMKNTQLAIRFADSHIQRLKELAAALGSDNLSGAIRWAVQNAPDPKAVKPSRKRRPVAKQTEMIEAVG